MKPRIAVVLLLLTLILAAGALPGQAAEQPSVPAMPEVDGVAAGGAYRVVVQTAPTARVLARQASGAIAGGQYRLEPPDGMSASSVAAPASSENGCCCIYLPCIRR